MYAGLIPIVINTVDMLGYITSLQSFPENIANEAQASNQNHLGERI